MSTTPSAESILRAVASALGVEIPVAASTVEDSKPRARARKTSRARKANSFYSNVIASRVPCAMGPEGAPVKGCTRRFAANGSGATNHLRHGKA